MALEYIRFFLGLSWADAGGPARGWAGPGRAFNFLYDGPRPGPAHQFLIWWAAAGPGPSNLQRMGRGPARPIKISEDGPRSGPAHHIFNFSRPGPARTIKFSKVLARPGPARHNFHTAPVRPGPDKRPMTSPGFFIIFDVYNSACLCPHAVILKLSVTSVEPARAPDGRQPKAPPTDRARDQRKLPVLGYIPFFYDTMRVAAPSRRDGVRA